jgi:hypothetical protein
VLLLAPKYCILVDIFPKKFRPERRFPHGAREPAFPATQNPPLLRLFQYSSTPPGHCILSPFPARGRFVSARVVPRRTSRELTVGGKYMFKGYRLLIGVSIVLGVLFSSGVLKSSARPEAEPGIISRGPSRAAILRETGHDADTPAQSEPGRDRRAFRELADSGSRSSCGPGKLRVALLQVAGGDHFVVGFAAREAAFFGG